MRILYLGNNWVGWQVFKWLKEQGEEITGVVIHPLQKQRYAKEILEAAQLPVERIFDGSRLSQPEVIASIRQLKPEIGLSILFDYILKPEFLSIFRRGVINLHPAYLPYNRGQYPNVWSIIEGTPSGVTLHYIDNKVDTGDIITQKQVPVAVTDTGETLYRKLEQASLTLFMDTWPLIKSGKAPRISQSSLSGTHHYTRDVKAIDEIKMDEKYTARDIINTLRARTFHPYPGAYFVHQGRRVYLRLQLLSEEQLDEGEKR